MYINEKRDMALVEARGEEYLDRMGKSIEDIAQLLREQDASTWEGFGALFTWAKEQDWWSDFLEENGMVVQKKEADDTSEAVEVFEYFPVNLMDPDEFADAIIAYLDDLDEQKEKKPSEGESKEPEETEIEVPMGACNGSMWSNCIKEKCEHFASHDTTLCKSHYCHDIKRMVWCTTAMKNIPTKTVTPSAGNGHDVWST